MAWNASAVGVRVLVKRLVALRDSQNGPCEVQTTVDVVGKGERRLLGGSEMVRRARHATAGRLRCLPGGIPVDRSPGWNSPQSSGAADGPVQSRAFSDATAPSATPGQRKP